MPKFSYIVKDRDGKTIKDVVTENSQEQVVAKLQKEGYFIISVKELVAMKAGAKSAKKNVRKYTHMGTKLEDMVSFARQLATMLESGVPLIRSINVIQSQVECKELALVLTDVKDRVENGASLSQAIAKHPKVFNTFWVSLIEVGEASGTIPVVLGKLTFYMEQQAHFNSTIISGMIYPGVLFCVCMGAVAFFALFVGPRFEAIFTTMHAELPAFTVLVLGIFKFVKANFLLLIAGTVGGVWSFLQFIKTYHGRTMWEQFLFNAPVVGGVYRLIIVERFTGQMAILIDAGVPILYALDIAERLVDNNTCALIVNDIKEAVREGELLVAPMERSGFFPGMAVQMIMVGEETGELGKMLKHVATYYQEQVETYMKRFSTIIEPFMLVFMGAMIGTIVLAMFLPMFNLSQINTGA
ncbi:MAG: type II secretion system F family protein [Candidatus Omnitrophica bacterium]|nr:type II secretion system F family protein [Candidatus Omnitrophota bacterium]